MYHTPEFISLPQQLVFRPYLPPSTICHCSLSNKALLPLSSKKNPRIVKPRASTDQKILLLNFLNLQKNLACFVRTSIVRIR